ncbi:MAG: 4Fe-4S single cluster domain-containing protein [Lawsonibacter sp.]
MWPTGPGIRVSLFVSGCTHACPECFNPEAWGFSYGQALHPVEAAQILQALEKPYIKGLSLRRAEPFHPANQTAVLDLVRQVREPDSRTKDVWCYSGYLFRGPGRAAKRGRAQPGASGAAGCSGGRSFVIRTEKPGAAVPWLLQPAHPGRRPHSLARGAPVTVG